MDIFVLNSQQLNALAGSNTSITSPHQTAAASTVSHTTASTPTPSAAAVIISTSTTPREISRFLAMLLGLPLRLLNPLLHCEY